MAPVVAVTLMAVPLTAPLTNALAPKATPAAELIVIEPSVDVIVELTVVAPAFAVVNEMLPPAVTVPPTVIARFALNVIVPNKTEIAAVDAVTMSPELALVVTLMLVPPLVKPAFNVMLWADVRVIVPKVDVTVAPTAVVKSPVAVAAVKDTFMPALTAAF